MKYPNPKVSDSPTQPLYDGDIPGWSPTPSPLGAPRTSVDSLTHGGGVRPYSTSSGGRGWRGSGTSCPRRTGGPTCRWPCRGCRVPTRGRNCPPPPGPSPLPRSQWRRWSGRLKSVEPGPRVGRIIIKSRTSHVCTFFSFRTPPPSLGTRSGRRPRRHWCPS